MCDDYFIILLRRRRIQLIKYTEFTPKARKCSHRHRSKDHFEVGKFFDHIPLSIFVGSGNVFYRDVYVLITTSRSFRNIIKNGNYEGRKKL